MPLHIREKKLCMLPYAFTSQNIDMLEHFRSYLVQDPRDVIKNPNHISWTSAPIKTTHLRPDRIKKPKENWQTGITC